MKKIVLGLAIGLCVPALTFASIPTTKQQKLSYTLGVGLGKSLKLQQVAIDLPNFVQGLEDAYQGKRLQLSNAEMTSLVKNFREQRLQESQANAKVLANENLKQANAFLAANKNKSGIKTLPSGIQYKVIKAGTGKKPTKESTVTVNYEGRLLNGQVFDSSYQRGKPATFPLSVVIPGWQKVLPQMKTGAIWEVYIPPQLAYKEQGVPGSIGPNELLIFKINLISIDK